MKSVSWVNVVLGVCVALGVWLIAAPFALGYRGTSIRAAGEDVILGIVIVGCSLWVALRPDAPAAVSWLIMLFGVWVVIAPFVLGYRTVTVAFANDVIVGMLLLILTITRLLTAHRLKRATS